MMINISLTSQTVSTSKDGSTEFVFAEKKFPLHMREDCAAVFLEGLDEGVCVYVWSHDHLLLFNGLLRSVCLSLRGCGLSLAL